MQSEIIACDAGGRQCYEKTKPIDLRLNLDFLDENKANISNTKSLEEESSEKYDNDEDSENDDDYDENPFSANRNIQTVKVNQARKPLEQTLIEQSQLNSEVKAENGKLSV